MSKAGRSGTRHIRGCGRPTGNKSGPARPRIRSRFERNSRSPGIVETRSGSGHLRLGENNRRSSSRDVFDGRVCVAVGDSRGLDIFQARKPPPQVATAAVAWSLLRIASLPRSDCTEVPDPFGNRKGLLGAIDRGPALAAVAAKGPMARSRRTVHWSGSFSFSFAQAGTDALDQIVIGHRELHLGREAVVAKLIYRELVFRRRRRCGDAMVGQRWSTGPPRLASS